MRRILILITLLVVTLSGYFIYQEYLADHKKDQKMFDLVMLEKMDLLYAQAKDWKKPLSLKVEDERLDGDFKIMSEFILKFWMKNIEARNSYLRQLDRVKWDEFLDIERLDQDRRHAYAQTKSMLSTVRQATLDYEKEHKEITDQAIRQVQELDVNKAMRQSMHEKLLLTRDSSNETALLHIELEILDRAEQMFEMLKTRKWQKTDDMILFAEDNDVRKFNVLYAEIIEFQQQIEELKRKNASEIESEVN